MKRWVFFFTTFTALILSIQIARVYAANPAPIQISPQNGQLVTSTRLEWLVPDYTIKSTSPYRVQVDDQSDFLTPLKDTLTANTFYTPQLTEGVWYWRVLAKDQNSIDSAWSQTATFIYSTTIILSPSPTPTIQPSPLNIAPSPSVLATPSPSLFSPSPTPSITISPTPTPSPSFTLSTLPSQINSTESFQLLISLYLPQSPQTTFYLKGAFYEDGSSNYFGQTKYADNWIKNSQTFSSQYKIQTDSQGKWQGKIEFIPDPQDSGFSSSGEYHFKVARYTSAGSGPTWSDNQTIYINEIIIPSPSPSASPSPSSSTKTEAMIEYPINSISHPTLLISESSPSALEASSSALNIEPEIASIAGVTTVAGDITSKPPITPTSKINPSWFYLSSGILFLIGIASAFVVKYQLSHKIKQWLFPPIQPKTPRSSPPLWQRDLPHREEWWH